VEVIRVIGSGSMGEVCFARDHALLRDVAFKRLKPDQPDMGKRLEREARIGAQLDHPHIVPVHRLLRGPDDQPLGYVMKLVQGEDLGQLLTRVKQRVADKRPLETDERLPARLRILRHIIDAVAYAHDKGVIHRDLKPSNILIAERGSVYLTDWGLAKVQRGRSPLATLTTVQTGGTSEEPTKLGALLGTVAYMSPEQANGRTEGLGPESDVFSLGVMLLEILQLHHPYLDDPHKSGVFQAVKHGRLEPLEHSKAPEPVADELLAIARKATATRPEDRYPDAGAMADDLDRYARGEPVEALPDTVARKATRAVRNRPELGIGVVVTLLLVDLFLLVYVVLNT
jgi:serine/threonine protein kinase